MVFIEVLFREISRIYSFINWFMILIRKHSMLIEEKFVSEENIKPMFQLNVCMRMEWKKVERKILLKKKSTLFSVFFCRQWRRSSNTRRINLECLWRFNRKADRTISHCCSVVSFEDVRLFHSLICSDRLGRLLVHSIVQLHWNILVFIWVLHRLHVMLLW